jgi:nicotinamidase-related amidase
MKTVIDIWEDIEPPPAPTLQPVQLDPQSSALLVLDLQIGNCNSERRPRCVESLAGIQAFISRARSHKIPVIFSLTTKATAADIREEVLPQPEEPIVKSSVDKFYHTDLGELLKNAGAATVVLIGTAAEGAIVHTAAGAALRGYNVVVPVDGISSSNVYAEQYAAWHLVNAPGIKKRTTLTRMDLISF